MLGTSPVKVRAQLWRPLPREWQAREAPITRAVHPGLAQPWSSRPSLEPLLQAGQWNPPPHSPPPGLTHQALPLLLLAGLLLGLQLHHGQGRPHGGAGQGAGSKACQQAQPALLQARRQGPLPGAQPIAAGSLVLLQLIVLVLLLGALIWRAENRVRVRALARAGTAPRCPLRRCSASRWNPH